MSIALFKDKVFEVTSDKIYTFNEFQYSSTLETESQDASGKKPSTYNKGPGLSGFGFKIPLSVDYGVNPRKEIEDWEAMKDAAVAYPFILGKKPWGKNKWLLISVDPVGSVIDNDGNILSCDLSLKFQEYVRPGSAQASKTGSTAAPGISLPPISGDISILSGSENKVAYKRKSSGALEA